MAVVAVGFADQDAGKKGANGPSLPGHQEPCSLGLGLRV